MVYYRSMISPDRLRPRNYDVPTEIAKSFARLSLITVDGEPLLQNPSEISTECPYPHDSIMILASGGIAKLSPNPDSGAIRSITTNLYAHPGMIIGHENMFEQSSQKEFNLLPLRPSTVHVLKATVAKELFLNSIDFQTLLMDSISNTYSQAVDFAESQNNMNLPARMINFFQKMSHLESVELTHVEIARMVGSIRESVSAILTEFDSLGIMERGYSTIRFKDTIKDIDPWDL